MKKLVVPILLISLVFCLFTSNLFVSPQVLPYVITIVMFSFLSAAIYYGNRNTAGPLITKITIWVIGIFSLGFGLYIGTGSFAYFLLGILGIPLVLIWINYLRYPPYLWKFLWLFRRKRQPEAAQYINEWIRSHPDDWKALIMRSDFYLNRAQFVDAERDSRMAIKLKPDFHEGYNQLGRSLMIMAQYEETRRAFESAQRLKPNSGYLANIGIACYRLGDFPAAIQALTQATRKPLDFQFHNLAANYYLGQSLENMGEHKKAQEAFKKMSSHAKDIKLYIEQANATPDYPENVALRADLAEMLQRLNT